LPRSLYIDVHYDVPTRRKDPVDLFLERPVLVPVHFGVLREVPRIRARILGSMYRQTLKETQ